MAGSVDRMPAIGPHRAAAGLPAAIGQRTLTTPWPQPVGHHGRRRCVDRHLGRPWMSTVSRSCATRIVSLNSAGWQAPTDEIDRLAMRIEVAEDDMRYPGPLRQSADSDPESDAPPSWRHPVPNSQKRGRPPPARVR